MKKLIAVAAAAAALFSLAGTANALVLTPSSPNMIAGVGYGPSNCEPGCVTTVFGLAAGSLSLLYKDESGLWSEEEGTYDDSYETYFDSWFELDPEAALIDYISGPAINCSSCYLAIKDGNSTPGYYFYNLTGWNGTESIYLDNFWPNRGAISHVSIWGTGGTSVPEPSTLALLGIGLLGAGLAKRRRKS